MHKRNLSILLAVAIAATAFGSAARAQEGSEPRRNVIFILSDDHRYDFMSFLDTPPFLETPALDRMAAKGVHIQYAFVSTSLCSPSRASILTGQYAHRHGVVDNQRDVAPGTRFFPELMQEAGYETAFIGKWHMGDDNDAPRPGFDHWVSFRGQGVYSNPLLNIDGAREQHTGYTAEILTDYAIDWLGEEREQPFFLYLSHKSVHAMFEPDEQDLGRYDGYELPQPVTMPDTEERREAMPDWVVEQRNSWHGVDYMYHGAMDFDTFYRRYTETLHSLDRSIGRLVDFLEDSGLERNTLVIYMGDNGFSFGEHGLIDKRQMYEESMRVPMLAYGPGMIDPGTTMTQMVQNIDIAPTMLEIAGVEPPPEMDGRSFLPLLEGRAVEWRDSVIYEYYWEWNYPQTPTMFGLRTDQFKYIFYYGLWENDELFDLVADPYEENNLALQPGYRAQVNELRRELFTQLEATGGMQIPLRAPAGGRAANRGPTE